MDRFRKRYRIPSARAQWWDYGSNGAYFITICTAGREWLLGEISNNEMHLSPIGEIVYQEWNVSFDMRAELFCDVFVIMPNHIHAILRIDKRSQKTPSPSTVKTGVAHRSPKSISSFVAGFKSSATKRINQYRRDARPCVSTIARPVVPGPNDPKTAGPVVPGPNDPKTAGPSVPGPNDPKTTGPVVPANTPVWQPRFHDHIIRNDDEYQRIFKYIKTNIPNWGKDKFYRKGEPCATMILGASDCLTGGSQKTGK